MEAHAHEDAFFFDVRSRVRLRERNFPSLSSTETPKTKVPTSLEVPPGTRPTEKELLLRWPTKTNEVEGFLTTSHLTNSYMKV